MKIFDKAFVSMLVLLLILVVLLLFFLNMWANDVGKEKEKFEKHIGEQYILNKDTLIIVDYSMFKETFTLSNGKEINYKLIENMK